MILKAFWKGYIIQAQLKMDQISKKLYGKAPNVVLSLYPLEKLGKKKVDKL